MSNEVEPGWGHQRSEFFDQFEGLQDNVCGSIRPGALEPVGESAIEPEDKHWAASGPRPVYRHKRSRPGRSEAETATLAWRLKPPTFAHREPVRASRQRSSMRFPAVGTRWPAWGPVAMRPATEALGHAFFTLSLGMGAMLTYGSYLAKRDDIVSSAITICVLDTLIALAACMVLFPIIFTYGMEPASGPGLVFVSIPIALSQMPAGSFLAVVFFALLLFAALTSAISLLEVVTSYLIDEKGWLRHKATVLCGIVIALIGIPSALSGGTTLFGDGFAGVFGMNWFDSFDYLATNWILPLGGLGISLFTAYRVDDAMRHREFLAASRLAIFYRVWLVLLKFVVPAGIVLVFLHAVGLI